ncbi:MAG: ATP synthase F0 subunit B [Desulfovibrio sp.]|nr:ATP synthase F0 subunit B [Desulfovibrio sp.]
MLDFDITLLFQLANFLIALFLLNKLLIKPVREVLAKRRRIIDDMTGEAVSFETQAEKSLADYEAALQRARQDAGAARQQGREAGTAEQMAIVGEAQKKAKGILDDARLALKKEADATLAALRGQVAAVSKRVADKLVQG